jgi:hypothetical protein
MFVRVTCAKDNKSVINFQLDSFSCAKRFLTIEFKIGKQAGSIVTIVIITLRMRWWFANARVAGVLTYLLKYLIIFFLHFRRIPEWQDSVQASWALSSEY